MGLHSACIAQFSLCEPSSEPKQNLQSHHICLSVRLDMYVGLKVSPVRYPNWINSMFEFRSKLIQFNIRFKINSKDYSIFNDFCDSIQYIIQFKMSHLDSLQ